VLFCDLVGFTARSDNADPEDVRATLRPYHASLRKDLERYGGTVEKFIGDAVMAVFGAPVAHEDDAERAVRAALRIIDSIEELNEQHPGFDLSVRIGVNTGEAVDEPSVQLVTITGEPGVGKTRLLWEFRAHLDDRPELTYWRQGRSLPYGEGVTYWALGEMVKAQAGVLETDSPEEALAKLDTALAAVTRDEADRDWLRGRLAPLVGVEVREGQQDDRDEAFAAW